MKDTRAIGLELAGLPSCSVPRRSRPVIERVVTLRSRCSFFRPILIVRTVLPKVMNRTASDLSSLQEHSRDLVAIPSPASDPDRWQRGRELAGVLAGLLRERFGATRVAVFGSLNHPERFDSRSDIDLAVWGVPPARFYRAVADVTAISPEFEVDLVDGDACSTPLRYSLESEAITL